MDATLAYQFLKPSLDEMTQSEKDLLCELISGKPEPKSKPEQRASQKQQDLKDIAMLKKGLLKTGLFKN